MEENSRLYFYLTARKNARSIRRYNEETYGKEHARHYMGALYDGIETYQKSGVREISSNIRNAFSQHEIAYIRQHGIYSFHWKEKPHQKRGYTVFWRDMPDGRMGIISILGDGMHYTHNLKQALRKMNGDQQ